MGKLLRLRDKFLIGLALAGDIIIPALIRAGRGLPPYKLYSWAGFSRSGGEYKKQTFYTETWKLLRTGDIEKVIKNGKPFLRLTNKGERRLIRDFPFFKLQKKKWDYYWCFVIFDFPEKERSSRDYLRRKLLELNFGRLQKSIYISPYDFTEDIVQFLANKKFLGKTFVLYVKHRFMGDARDLANRVWKLEKFNNQYWEIITTINKLKQKKLINPKKIITLKQKYLKLITEDPFLPIELLPSEWAREEAYQAIIEISSQICYSA